MSKVNSSQQMKLPYRYVSTYKAQNYRLLPGSFASVNPARIKSQTRLTVKCTVRRKDCIAAHMHKHTHICNGCDCNISGRHLLLPIQLHASWRRFHSASALPVNVQVHLAACKPMRITTHLHVCLCIYSLLKSENLLFGERFAPINAFYIISQLINMQMRVHACMWQAWLATHFLLFCKVADL